MLGIRGRVFLVIVGLYLLVPTFLSAKEIPKTCAPQSPHARSELGRYLFYDVQLSGPGYMACASCHKPELASTDGRATALGVTGQPHSRNTQSLLNVSCFRALTWIDPKQKDLARQSSILLFSQTPVEMASAGREEEILARLRVSLAYQERFKAAFPDTGGRIDWPSIQTALADFQKTLLSFDSPYDQHIRANNSVAILSQRQQKGMDLFMSERLGCSKCHPPPLFTDADQPNAYHNTGLYNIDGRGGLPEGPQGLIEHTGNPEDLGRFRTLLLRNVSLTAPYMHDGSMATLSDVIDHYAASGRSAIEGLRSPLTDGRIRRFELGPSEKSSLLAFLESLTDRNLIGNPSIQSPYRFAE